MEKIEENFITQAYAFSNDNHDIHIKNNNSNDTESAVISIHPVTKTIDQPLTLIGILAVIMALTFGFSIAYYKKQ